MTAPGGIVSTMSTRALKILLMLFVSALFAAGVNAAPASKPGGTAEPTNATEAAAKKAAADKAVDEKYQAWKATLPPEQRKWEETLEANLGNFYLPIHKQEKVKSTANAWDYVADDPKLPRVLLIGDSVSRGYTMAARAALAGKANVHRAPENCGPTANGLKKLDVWLGDGKWDVIHFNFGLHDAKFASETTQRATREQYAENLCTLTEITTRLQKTGAKLIWASTTPIPRDDAKKQNPESIVERNAIAARIMQSHHAAVDDLFTFITPHLATAQNPNDVHFTAAGYQLLGQQVAASVEAALKAK
jgi:lysophospholipase L1-like esterase